MSEVAYTSNCTIKRIRGPLRLATIPAESEPVRFGVHSEIAEHYGVDMNVHNPNATTIDYVIAAAAG